LIPALTIAFAVRWGSFFLANRIEASAANATMLYVFLILVNLLLIAAIYRSTKQLGKSRPLAERFDRPIGRLLGFRRSSRDKPEASQ
jgi:hypothetical protein